MVHKLNTQVYKFILDVIVFGYSPEYIKAIAMVHERPEKLIVQARDYGIIDAQTCANWIAQIVK